MLTVLVFFALFFCRHYGYFIEVMEGSNFCVSDDYAVGTVVKAHYNFEVETTVANKKPVDVIIVVKDANSSELFRSTQNSSGHFSFTSNWGEHSICFETKVAVFGNKRHLFMHLDIKTGLYIAHEEYLEKTPEKFFGSIDSKVSFRFFFFFFVEYI
jgi:hypothetical protein